MEAPFGTPAPNDVVRALILQAGRARVVADCPEPDPRPGEARIRPTLAGVCATDLALARGYMGFEGVPGHEFVGVALEGALEGRRVVGEINAACGQCDRCLAGLGRHCDQRSVLGILDRAGAFAERLVLPEVNLLEVPDSVRDEHAVFTEPLAAALEIGEQITLRPGQRALVAGDGRLGILCAQVLALAGLEVVLAGRHPEYGDWLPNTLEHRIGLLEQAPPASRPFDLAVEATGNPDVLPRLFGWVRPRGTVVLKTTSEKAGSLDLAPLVIDELTLLGSRCGPFAPALELLARDDLVLDPMISGRYALGEADRALEHAARKGTLKVLIDFES